MDSKHRTLSHSPSPGHSTWNGDMDKKREERPKEPQFIQGGWRLESEMGWPGKLSSCVGEPCIPS